MLGPALLKFSDKGNDRANPGYSWGKTDVLATNYRMSELQGACALAQLPKLAAAAADDEEVDRQQDDGRHHPRGLKLRDRTGEEIAKTGLCADQLAEQGWTKLDTSAPEYGQAQSAADGFVIWMLPSTMAPSWTLSALVSSWPSTRLRGMSSRRSLARISPTRNSTRSGPSAKPWVCSSSCTRLAPANWNRAAGWPGMVS